MDYIITFTAGVLATVAVIVSVLAVLAFRKAYKLEKTLQDLSRDQYEATADILDQLSSNVEMLTRNIHSVEANLYRELEAVKPE